MPQPSPAAPIHPDNLRADREVWYLTLQHDEAEIAFAWLAKHDPEAVGSDRVTDTIHLMQLRPNSSVVLLLRKPKGPRAKISPTQPIEVSKATGDYITIPVEPDSLIGEMEAYGPVNCEDYWIKGATRYSSSIDRPRFLAKLGELAAGVAHFGFADVSRKDGLPDLLQIRPG